MAVVYRMELNDKSKIFLLVKPDGLQKEKLNYIKSVIHDKGMYIINESRIKIDIDQMVQIWPYCKTDPVCKRMMSRYMCNKEMLLLDLVSSEDRIECIKEVKRQIRKKYAASPISNVVHAPSNLVELERDYRVLTGKRLVKDYPNVTLVREFRSFQNITKQEYVECALSLENIMKTVTFQENFKMLESNKGRYKIYLLNDTIHDARYTAGVLLDYYEDLSLEQAYYISIGTNYLGEFPLTTAENVEDIEKLRKYLDGHSFKIRFV